MIDVQTTALWTSGVWTSGSDVTAPTARGGILNVDSDRTAFMGGPMPLLARARLGEVASGASCMTGESPQLDAPRQINAR